jgi:hypothetical protein
MTTTKVGLDIGNGYVKAYDGKRLVHFPSTAAPAHDIHFTLGNGGDTLALGDQSWFIGDYAREQAATDALMHFGERRDAHLMRVLMLTALGRLGIRGDVALCVGLPTLYYNDANKAAARRDLEGRYRFTYNGTEHDVRVAIPLILPQPVGSYFSVTVDDEGQSHPLRGRTVATDIGTYTTDFATVDHYEGAGVRYVGDSSGSIEHGMSDIVRSIQVFASDHGRRLDYAGAEAALVGRRQTFTVYDKEVSAVKTINAALDTLSTLVIAELDNKVSDRASVRHHLVSGGGASAILTRLRAWHPNSRLVTNPWAANAVGFWKSIEHVFKDKEV